MSYYNGIYYSGTVYVGDENADTFNGTIKNDYFLGYGGQDKIFGDDGSDVINGGDGNDHLEGGDGGDRVYGGSGVDEIEGNDGNDTLYGNDGNDLMQGNDGNDHLYGDLGNDELEGNDGHDRLYGDDGDDELYGGDGNDELYGEDGDDELYGGDGDDTIRSFYGNDIIDGGSGDDWLELWGKPYSYSIVTNADSSLSISLDSSGGGGSAAPTAPVKNIEHIRFIGVDSWGLEVNQGEWHLADHPPVVAPTGDCPHTTGQYKLSGTWSYTGKPKDICETNGSLTISHVKGPSSIKVSGAGLSTHDGNVLKVSSGVISATVYGQTTQLFTSSVELPFASGLMKVQDSSNNVGDLKIAGLDLVFKNLQVLSTSVRGDVAFVLPSSLVGDDIPITLDAGFVKGLTAIVDNSGVRLGTSASLDIKDMEMKFLNIFKASATNQKIAYTAVNDTLTMQGKYEIDPFIRVLGVDKFEMDLSGPNSIQIKSGHADVKGSLALVIDDDWSSFGWGISKVQLDVDTKAKTLGGTIGIKFPFNSSSAEIAGSLEFKIKPYIELNAIGVKVDHLNDPIGTTGVFVKSMNAKLEHMSVLDKAPISLSGGFELTAGPEIAGVALATLGLQATVDQNQLVGDGKLTVINDKILTATVKAVVNWNKGFTSIDGKFNALNGFIVSQDSFKANGNFDFAFEGIASVNVPTFVAGIGGQTLASSNYRVSFSNDGDLSNDFIAGWKTQGYSAFGANIQYTLGAKYTFDGEWSLFGLNSIPQSEAFAKTVIDPTSQFAKLSVDPASDWIFLMAKWENATADSMSLVVIDPNGNVINEANFASHKIKVMDNLSNEFSKTLVVISPIAGDWKVELTNSSGRGAIEYSVASPNEMPVLDLTSPSSTLADPDSVTIGFDAYDADSTASLSLYYDNDNKGFDGMLFKSGITETDGSGSFVWDLSGMNSGNYYVYGILSDDVNPVVKSYATGRIEVTEVAETLTGTAQNDKISGKGGNDVIKGLAGDDILLGFNGADNILDGLGSDRLDGHDGADKLFALSGLNFLDGGDGNDLLVGGMDSDTIVGGIGNDVIRGDVSNLLGGSDWIEGGAGNDLLMGGDGADVFKFSTNDGKDIIGQFKTDKVSFDTATGYNATATAADFQIGIDLIELSGFSTTNASNVLDFISQADDGAVFNHEGTEITLFGINANQLSASDFLFS